MVLYLYKAPKDFEIQVPADVCENTTSDPNSSVVFHGSVYFPGNHKQIFAFLHRHY